MFTDVPLLNIPFSKYKNHSLTLEDVVWCRLTLGLVMLGLKGVGFLCAFIYSFYSSLSAAKEFVLRYAWPYIPFLAKRPADKFADIVDKVMLQVSLVDVISIQL